jgi:hypothetical protein
MDYGKVLKRVWNLVWSYRVLWIWGAILALTTINGFYFGYDWNRDENNQGITIQVTDDNTLYLPGQGVTIDLTRPDGVSIKLDDGNLEREWRETEYLFSDVIPRGVHAVLITLAVAVGSMILIGLIARYVAEAAMIRMVDETEEGGERLSLGQGLRLGFSRSAWRLFLIDLVIKLPVTCAFIVLFIVALMPLWLWTSGSVAASVAGTLATAGLLFLVISLLIVVNTALSLLVQVIRRASGVDDLGVFASIGKGLSMVRGHVKETIVMWLIWLGLRLGWMIASVPVLIVLFPIVLLFIVAGALLGGIPALLVGGVMQLFLSGPFPWIVGAVVGLPIFVLVMMTPMLFLGGLVEVAKSSLWTLTYREMRALESMEKAQVPTADASGLEVAPAS